MEPLRRGGGYLRDPLFRFLSRVWRVLDAFRLGLEITKVPLPRYVAL
jgi:hypothetical protein